MARTLKPTATRVARLTASHRVTSLAFRRDTLPGPLGVIQRWVEGCVNRAWAASFDVTTRGPWAALVL